MSHGLNIIIQMCLGQLRSSFGGRIYADLF